MTRKNQRIFSVLLKIAILILAYFSIFRALNDNENLRNFNGLIKNLSHYRVYAIVVLTVLLMFLNWFLESLKWKFLVKEIEPISTWKAVESVFCGLTWAVFTFLPNRIGEYGGRVLFLSPRKRIFGAIAMGVGSIGQLAMTNVFGALALLWFAGQFLSFNFWLYIAIIFLTIIFCSFFIILFFNIRWLTGLLLKISFLKRFSKFFAVLTSYKKSALLKVFLYSLARFITFTSQYCLIITLLIPDISIFQTTMMTCILFFVQSALPSLNLFDVVVRTMTAKYFFSYITNQEIAIVASTAYIWLINLVIPAILGSVFVLKMNFFGTDSN